MSTTPTISKVWFAEEKIFVELNDKQIISVPLSCYPRLQNADSKQRNDYEVWNNGKWLHWEKLNEDLSAEGFLKYYESGSTSVVH